ncbi:MAG: type II toxin-antitoxin system VapC family toxin [Candidatus Acidiferrales bacterium]
MLDTHAVIWYLHSPTALSPHALQSIRNAVGNGRPVFVSAISLVETIYLVERGRLPLEALRRLREAVNSKASGLLVQPLDEAVAEVVRTISRQAVPDMPDRIIAATASYLGLPLVTRDRRLQSAGINTVW